MVRALEQIVQMQVAADVLALVRAARRVNGRRGNRPPQATIVVRDDGTQRLLATHARLVRIRHEIRERDAIEALHLFKVDEARRVAVHPAQGEGKVGAV